jgi:hypothetical protein
MAEKTLNTVIVLRNDKSTDWATSDVILKEGEVGVSYLDNGNVIVKAGNGVDKWPELKQVEGVFEQPVTLTQNFGYYNDVPTGGYKTYADTEGMTTSEFLLSALKKTVEPTITQPSISAFSATATVENDDPEVGAKITALNWNGTFSAGSYKIGTATQSTGLSASNVTWDVSNSIDSQTATTEDGKFTLTSDKYIEINTDGSATYARIDAVATLDASGAKTPKNNLGEETSGKITNTTAGSPWSKTADVSVTGYRKPFWGVIAAAEGLKNPEDFESADVRALPGSATSANGFPTSLAVPAGSQMVVFFAQAGKYSTLTATDDKAMNAGVTFTKVANACDVEGANGFTAAKYDLWYVNWGAGIGSDKQLTLKWS